MMVFVLMHDFSSREKKKHEFNFINLLLHQQIEVQIHNALAIVLISLIMFIHYMKN